MDANKLILDLKENDQMKAALSGLEPGESVEIKLVVTVTSADEELFEADIDSAEVEGSESADVDEDSPVMLLIAKKPTKGKDKESESMPEETMD